jgi:thymidine kinase
MMTLSVREILILATGTIELICGCMFSGKTELLLERLAEARVRELAVAVFKHANDQRYALHELVSHSGRRCEAKAVTSAEEILAGVGMARLVLVDEAQFFGSDLPDVCRILAARGCVVVVAGLDRDAWGQPFGPIPRIAADAQVVTRMRAVCGACGETAEYTQRLTPIEGDSMIGGIGVYEPRCAVCFRAPPIELRR